MIAYNPRRWRDHFFDIRGSMVREIAYRVGGCVLFAIAAELMYLEGLPVAFSDKAHLLVGPALALLLVFRTNSANDRYWEGRRLWGGVVNSARNLRRKARVLFVAEPVRAALVVEWTIAFFWSMRFRLLGRASLGPTCALPEVAQAKALLANSVPLAAADAITALLDDGRKSGLVSDIQQSLLDADVQALVDHLGGCERIDQTPLPYAYAVHLRRALFL